MIIITVIIINIIIISRCPDRYLFDPVTQLCQRESRVSCDQATNPLLLYSFRSALVLTIMINIMIIITVVIFNINIIFRSALVFTLSEENLETFFSQELTLPRPSKARQSPAHRLFSPVSYSSFIYPRHSPFIFFK